MDKVRAQLYARARLSGKNKKQSALAAGFAESTAEKKAWAMDDNPKVQAEFRRVGRDYASNEALDEVSRARMLQIASDPDVPVRELVSCLSIIRRTVGDYDRAQRQDVVHHYPPEVLTALAAHVQQIQAEQQASLPIPVDAEIIEDAEIVGEELDAEPHSEQTPEAS